MALEDGGSGHSQRPSLLVLFATEMGSAQDVADHVARSLRRVDFHVRVVSMDGYSPVCITIQPPPLFLLKGKNQGGFLEALVKINLFF